MLICTAEGHKTSDHSDTLHGQSECHKVLERETIWRTNDNCPKHFMNRPARVSRFWWSESPLVIVSSAKFWEQSQQCKLSTRIAINTNSTILPSYLRPLHSLKRHLRYFTTTQATTTIRIIEVVLGVGKHVMVVPFGMLSRLRQVDNVSFHYT